MNPNELIDRIKQLDERATKAPWGIAKGTARDEITHQDENLGTPIAVVQSPLMNTELIAEYRNITPRLATALREVKAVVERIRENYTDYNAADLIALTIADDIDHAIYDAITTALGDDDDQ